jgi:hypothetical protein
LSQLSFFLPPSTLFRRLRLLYSGAAAGFSMGSFEKSVFNWRAPSILLVSGTLLPASPTHSRSRAFAVSQAWGNVPYYETSARRRQNVQEVFVDVCRQIIRRDIARARVGGGESGGGGGGRNRRRRRERSRSRRRYDDEEDETCTIGVDVQNSEGTGTLDALDEGILDLLVTKHWAIKLATEAARTVLSVDQIIVARQAGGPKPPGPNPNWDED